MIYVTGDIHADAGAFEERKIFSTLQEGDFLIVLGDFGVGMNRKFEKFLDELEKYNFTVCFLDGNHENFDVLNQYPVENWHGGHIHRVRQTVIHWMRGQVYELEGRRFFAFGGGASEDQGERRARHALGGPKEWWEEEMPSFGEIENGWKNLEKNGMKVDYICTHGCSGITYSRLGIRKYHKERSLHDFFDNVAGMVEYRRWFFGHIHRDEEEIWKKQTAVYDSVIRLE